MAEIKSKKYHRFFASAVILLSFFITLVFSNISHATPVVGFEPGRIIDDLVFTYYQSMNVTQIQNFLNSKVPVCDTWHEGFYGTSGTWYGPPFTCLKDYTENGLTSAQIIYNTAQYYKINPQVLLVLLQKEQALITDTWPASYQYKIATGYGCPDTAPCDELYYGFTNQVENATNMFRKILDASPTWYTPYLLGNNYIQYSPNASCGGSNVYIQNRSTQALYNYTPYQPNQATLDAGYGSAYCGAYGNRNFYLYFTDWFGPTKRILVTSDFQNIYSVENNTKRLVPSSQIFISNYYKWADILQISSTELQNIPNGPAIEYNEHYRDYKLITSDYNKVYLVENGAKRQFPSALVFSSYPLLFKWADIINISETEIELIPNGPAMFYNVHFRNGKLVTSDNNGVFLIEDGLKRPFSSGQAFSSYSYKWADILQISSTELQNIPNGPAIT